MYSIRVAEDEYLNMEPYSCLLQVKSVFKFIHQPPGTHAKGP